ncbi:MAG: hypothetical protein ABW221_01790 [Vicinamibacteria bacterium]
MNRRVVLLAALAVAGLATVWFVRASGWKRVTWFSAHYASLGSCQTSTEARGATAAQAESYCGCVLATVERRWTPGEYQGHQREKMDELLADGTVDRCSAGGPAPDAASPERTEWNRRSWAPWRVEYVRTCTKQRAVDGRTTEQADAYCRCILGVVEPRWSPAEFRVRIDEAKRTLDQEGKRDACWTSAGVDPAAVPK